MEFNIIKKRVDPRGTSFTAFEPTNQPTFKDLVQKVKGMPWLSWVLCPYLKDFIDRDPLLSLKLNLVAAKPEIVIFHELLDLSDSDLFPAIALIELFNFHGEGWIFKTLDTTDPRFLYLDPFLKRAYHSKLRDSSEFQLIMWRLEQENGFFDPDRIGELDSQVREQMFELSKNLIPLNPKRNFTHIEELAKNSTDKRDYYYFTSLREVPVTQTMEKFKREKILVKVGVEVNSIEGPEYHYGTYHYKLTRKVDLKIENVNIIISGTLNSWGKGVSEELSWTSMVAEAVERFSAAMGIPNWPQCYKSDLDFMLSRMEDLIKRGKREGFQVLDPNKLNLIYPYQGEKTFWVRGINPAGNPIYVLAEVVFQPFIFNSPSFRYHTSNGLASGNTLDEAKLHAYCEIVERDSDARAMGDGDFKILEPNGLPEINSILKLYEVDDLVAYLRDVTMELGIPSYRIYLATKDKVNLSAIGTSLNGAEALIRAFAELNPFIPEAKKQGNLIEGIPAFLESCDHFDLESLPNYSTGNVTKDVQLLDDLFLKNGFLPIFVDLTVKAIDFPVVRLIIPGWEHMSIYYNDYRYFAAFYSALLNSKEFK